MREHSPTKTFYGLYESFHFFIDTDSGLGLYSLILHGYSFSRFNRLNYPSLRQLFRCVSRSWPRQKVTLINQSSVWFAVSVKARLENAVAESLRTKGYETFVARHPGNSSVLFPGYVFCRFDADIRSPIVTTAGVIRIVGFGGRPAAIEPVEMASLIKAVESGEKLRPLPHISEGEPVEIISGPLRGCRGVLTQIDKRLNFVVSICLLRRSIALAFRPEWVARAQTRDPIPEEIYAR